MMKRKNNPVKKKGLPKKKRVVVAHKARSWEEAEEWDLQYWQKLSPQQRIEALESLRQDWENIKNARQ